METRFRVRDGVDGVLRLMEFAAKLGMFLCKLSAILRNVLSLSMY